MKASTPPLLRATTRKWLARSARGTRVLVPESTKPSSLGSALVRGWLASKRGPGSTTASEPVWKRSPQKAGSRACFCSSVPWSSTALAKSEGATAATARAASP